MYRNHCDFRHKFRQQIAKVSLLVLCGLLSSANPAFSRIVKSDQGWVIRQSSNFAGTVLSEITDHALKMHIGRLGLIVITKAPEWNALVFNENSKTYIDLPYKQWQKRFTASDSGGKMVLIVRNSGKVTNIEQFKANEYWVLRRAELKKHIPEELVSQLWIASGIKAPPQIAQIFCSHLGIPAQKGIPLRAKRRINGKMVSALETLSVKRHVIPSSTFQPLAGYKKVKDEIELLMGDSNSEAMEELVNMSVNPRDSKTGIKK